MELPKIDMPTFEVKLPSTSKFVTMRPMNVRETKILLVAKEEFAGGENTTAALRAICKVIQLCTLSQFDVTTLSLADITMMYINLRSQSISNILKIPMNDETVVTVDLSNIEPDEDKRLSNTISVGGTHTSLMLRDVPVSVLLSEEYVNAANEEEVDEEKLWTIITSEVIAGVMIDDKNFDISTWDKSTLRAWLDTLPGSVFDDIRTHIDDNPGVTSTTKYKDAEGNEQELVLSSLYDFFLF